MAMGPAPPGGGDMPASGSGGGAAAGAGPRRAGARDAHAQPGAPHAPAGGSPRARGRPAQPRARRRSRRSAWVPGGRARDRALLPFPFPFLFPFPFPFWRVHPGTRHAWGHPSVCLRAGPLSPARAGARGSGSPPNRWRSAAPPPPLDAAASLFWGRGEHATPFLVAAQAASHPDSPLAAGVSGRRMTLVRPLPAPASAVTDALRCPGCQALCRAAQGHSWADFGASNRALLRLLTRCARRARCATAAARRAAWLRAPTWRRRPLAPQAAARQPRPSAPWGAASRRGAPSAGMTARTRATRGNDALRAFASGREGASGITALGSRVVQIVRVRRVQVVLVGFFLELKRGCSACPTPGALTTTACQHDLPAHDVRSTGRTDALVQNRV